MPLSGAVHTTADGERSGAAATLYLLVSWGGASRTKTTDLVETWQNKWCKEV